MYSTRKRSSSFTKECRYRRRWTDSLLVLGYHLAQSAQVEVVAHREQTALLWQVHQDCPLWRVLLPIQPIKVWLQQTRTHITYRTLASQVKRLLPMIQMRQRKQLTQETRIVQVKGATRVDRE